MLAGMLGQRVRLQQKVATQGALGQTVVWNPVAEYHARVIPLDVRTIAQFQQLNTVVSHKVILRGVVNIRIGVHRILHKGKTYEPSQSAEYRSGITEVVVREA